MRIPGRTSSSICWRAVWCGVTDDGESELTPGMCFAFAAGDGHAHQLVDRSDLPATVIEVGDRSAGDAVTYPHDDLEARLVDGRWWFDHKDGTPYEPR